MAVSLLEADGLERSDRQGRTRLLEDITFQIGGGDRLSFVGPTGSGKSLLLRALAGLDRLDGGEVRWRERTVAAAEMPRFRAAVMLVPQRVALPESTVEANLQLPFRFQSHRTRQYDRATVLQLCHEVGRGASFLEQAVDNLSGGEGQLVALIRALQLEPEVLLLDEPTSALDSATTHRVEALLEAWLNATPERAYVWVTHDEAQAQRVGRRRWSMRDGRLQEAS